MATSAIQRAAENKPVSGRKTIQGLMKSMEHEIAKALPSMLTAERFMRMVLTAASTTPKLYECTPESFLAAAMQAAQLGVEPNTPIGQAYLIPYYNKNKGALECQFQLGYKGMTDLAYRSGQVSLIQAHTVHEHDEFEYQFGLDPKLEHKPARTNRGSPIYYYAMFKTKDGGYGFEVMSFEEVSEHAKRYSKAYNSGPWKTNFDEMAKKTVLKRCLKYAPLKTELVRELSADGTVKNRIAADMYEVPDDLPVVEDDAATPPEQSIVEEAANAE